MAVPLAPETLVNAGDLRPASPADREIDGHSLLKKPDRNERSVIRQ